MLEPCFSTQKQRIPSVGDVRCCVCGTAAEMSQISPGFCMRDYYSLKIGRRIFDQIAENRLNFSIASPPRIFLALAAFFEVTPTTFVDAIEKAKEGKISKTPQSIHEEEMIPKEKVHPGFYMRDFYALKMGWRIFDQIITSEINFSLGDANDLFDILADYLEITETMICEVLQTATNQKIMHPEMVLEKQSSL